ncbi:FAD-binding oxidoreductase [Mammaliicoccus sp. Dog046]|uniref:FAD-binding oxidoreductase n=1 Tax=Mammaliicoccus sp. Dog046 TaxID=3034233 RepID=UPI002B25D0BB|nr:FAD-linked oxidase C-terminal domain-containing protein [Mammaliicoccus sp. Dog046]WQK86061.1 FAD-linked oxidase C-terminal domain-containing protein [Mammaliicoccus sp. Dog046]
MEELFVALQDALKKGHVSKEVADLSSYSYDASFGEYMPDIICQPMSTDEVVKIVKLSNQFDVPIYPRGSGTSLSGGPLPVNGGIVLDFSRWDNDITVYEDDLMMDVSPGVITAKIHEIAESYGLMYPPDPSSSSISTIGGNLAENAGGPRCLKYGVTKDYVVGLEIVTANGDVIRSGGRTVKNVTGYDMTKLMIGSEGTLGIITKATLQLIPKPIDTKTAMLQFDDFVTSGRAVSKILRSGILPSKIEIMDKYCVDAVLSTHPIEHVTNDAESVLLVELDGHPLALEAEMKVIEETCQALPGCKVIVARDKHQASELWEVRKLVSPAIVKFGPTKISEDTSVPVSQIPEFFKSIERIRQEFDLNLVVFGHAGDGNLHPNIITDKRKPEELKKAEQAVAEIFKASLKLGGTLSGEHGIGLFKKPFMYNEFDEAGMAFMKGVKKALDPNNRLNPGKIFPDENERFVLVHDE